jgi:hypothetical protein
MRRIGMSGYFGTSPMGECLFCWLCLIFLFMHRIGMRGYFGTSPMDMREV